VSIDAKAAEALHGVITVLSHENAPRLAPFEGQLTTFLPADLPVFQSDAVAYYGQFVAAVVAETLEIARQAASLVVIRYEEQAHHVELRADDSDLSIPQGPARGPAGAVESDTESGDVAATLAHAPVLLDHTYTTPAEHAQPLEPHATTVIWDDNGVTLYDSNQGAFVVQEAVAMAFRLPHERVRVIAPFVGGGFGSKGVPHASVILAVMAA
jgi:xanthine dehydrogenase YagR molybdenum-binding subunit